MSAGRSAGVPGIAVAMIGAGSLLVYSGIRNVPVLDALRSIAHGQMPTPPGAATFTTPPTAPPPRGSKTPPGVSVRPGAPTWAG